MSLVYIALFFLCIFKLVDIFYAIKIASLRKTGTYPLKGKECIEDVKKLLEYGEAVLATRCYRKIYKNMGLKEAVQNVSAIKSELEKTIL